MEIKPIRNEADYQSALKEIEKLMELQPDELERDRLDVLATLVDAYEARYFSIPEPDDPVEVLKYYLESRGLSRTDLIPYLGSKERVSEFFNRKRGLSLEMIRRLHHGLGIPAGLLLGRSQKAAPKPRPHGEASSSASRRGASS